MWDLGCRPLEFHWPWLLARHQDRNSESPPSQASQSEDCGSHHTIPSRIRRDRKSTRLNSSHGSISYAVFPTDIYTLSLHDALPISCCLSPRQIIVASIDNVGPRLPPSRISLALASRAAPGSQFRIASKSGQPI